MKNSRNTQQNADSERAQDIESRAPRRKGPKSLRQSRVSKRAERAGETAGELALVGPHSKDTNRNALGRYIAGNDGHLSVGTYSEKRWTALQAALREEHVNILRAKGFTEDDADPVMSKVVDGFNQAVVMMNSYFEFLASTGGPVSVKGRTRRACEGWSKAADRVHKFAMALGLERKSRRVNESVREFLDRERVERERAQHAEHDDEREHDDATETEHDN